MQIKKKIRIIPASEFMEKDRIYKIKNIEARYFGELFKTPSTGRNLLVLIELKVYDT